MEGTALFAESEVVAMSSGNIMGGIGCIVIVGVCFLLVRKSEKEKIGQIEYYIFRLRS